MVAANPFKPKEKVDVSDLDLNKIIEEEKTHDHNHGSVSSDSSLPGAENLAKITEAIETGPTKYDNEKSPFIKNPDIEEKIRIKPDENLNTEPKVEPKHEYITETKSELEFKPEDITNPEPTEFSRPPLPPRLDDFGNSKVDLPSSPPPLTSTTDEFRSEPLNFDETGISLNQKSIPFSTRAKKWFWRSRWFFIILILLALAVFACFLADKNLNKVEMNISSQGLRISHDKNSYGEEIPSELVVRVLAYNADTGASKELLYYVDTIAEVSPDGTINIAWDIPEGAISTRSTYNEFCILDEAKSNANVNDYCGGYGVPENAVSSTIGSSVSSAEKFNRISCSYYIPAHSTGLISFLSGWNKFDESQKVGCLAKDGAVWGTDSYIKKNNGPSETIDSENNETEINNISTTKYFFTNNEYYSTEVDYGADYVVYQYISNDKNVQYRRWASGYQELYARKSVSMRAGSGTIGSSFDWWVYNDTSFNSVWASENKKGKFELADLGIPDFKKYSEAPIAQCGVSNSDVKLIILEKVTKDSATCWAGDSGDGGDKTITYNLSATGFYDINN